MEVHLIELNTYFYVVDVRRTVVISFLGPQVICARVGPVVPTTATGTWRSGEESAPTCSNALVRPHGVPALAGGHVAAGIPTAD